MDSQIDKQKAWSPYYKNQKNLWYDPSVSLVVKSVVRLVELHRSDSRGWSLSVRKIAGYLGISNNTVIKAINHALDAGYLEATKRTQRVRRKLRLSVLLRAPVEFDYPHSGRLDRWEQQPVSPPQTEAVSVSEPVNNNKISTANSDISQFKKEIVESLPYKEKKQNQYPKSYSNSPRGGVSSVGEILKEMGKDVYDD